MTTETVLPDAPPAELAALLPQGNAVVLGGPGAGKTALLEAMMPALVADSAGGAVFLTSSRQAAVASSERLLASSASAATGALGCVTWYAFARGLVTSYADLLAYRGEPRLLSGPEQWSLVRSLLLETAGVDWGGLIPLVGTRAFTDELAEFVLGCERRLLGPDDLLDRVRAGGPPAWAPAAAFLSAYGERLALEDSVDHAGLVAQAGDLLEDVPEVLAATVARVGTVLVDEAQELDPVQLRLLDLLVAGGARAVLAGDPAGATDAFRGATPGALPGYARRFGAALVRLEHSRRLGGAGLDAVQRLQRGGGHAPVALRGGRTTAVEVARYPGPADEADAVARLLRVVHQRDGVAYGRMAVLLPSLRRTIGPIRRALERYGVPYRLGAGERQLVAEPIVRHVLDLFRLVLDPDRADELFPSLLTSPLGGIDPRELRVLRRAAVLADRTLAEHVRAPARELGVNARVAGRVAGVCHLLDQAHGWVEELDADACFWEVWRTAPFFARLVRRAEADPANMQAHRQLDALTAFSRALALFVDGRPGASMRTYLDVVERADFAGDPWLPPAMARTDAVALLSVNAAKGREYDVAVMAGCLEGLLPRTALPQGLFEAWRLDGDLDPVARAQAVLDAERRRFVLGASRARDRAVFTWSRVEGRGEPSRFLAELGVDLPAEPSPPDPTPLEPLEAAGTLRRVLTDRDRPAAERLAAAGTLAAMPGVDPGSWWWRRDWTRDPEPIAAEGRLRTSYSRISTYEDCHLRYFFGSVAGLDDRTSYQMAFGKLMHTVFELAAKGEIADGPEPLKAAFRERFDSSWFPSRAVAHQFWRDGMEMLELWHRSEWKAAKQALASEIDFAIEVGGHLIRGRIDRIDRLGDGIALLDYKTGRTLASDEEAGSSLQLAIYYLAALRDPELAGLGPPVEMQLVYPARPRQGRFARVSQRPGPDHAERVERRLLALLGGAAAESFDPNPHADCRFCPFKTICPMWPQGESFLAPTHPPAGLDAPHASRPGSSGNGFGPATGNGLGREHGEGR
jgi:superfamily I DNA/RNA helicase/RecB family exonuclease